MIRVDADLIIEGGLVVTVDSERRVIPDGVVAITGADLAFVGPRGEWRGQAAETIDAQGKLVLPGFIDGHQHPGHYLAKGLLDDVWVIEGLYGRVYPNEAAQTEEDAYFAALGSFAEALSTGTTLVNDPGNYHPDAVCQAAADIGIRLITAHATADVDHGRFVAPPGALSATPQSAVDRAEALHRRWDGAADGRIHIWHSLRTTESVSDGLVRAVKSSADRLGAGIHMHAACTAWEVGYASETWGCRSIERLDRLGLLGPTTYLAHMGFVDDHEVDLLVSSDANVVHCPAMSAHLGAGDISEGRMPVMEKRGVRVTLGSDGAGAGRFLDLVRVMYMAATTHKDHLRDPLAWGAHRALEMVTRDAAQSCLQGNALGSLEAGRRADINIVDMSGPEWTPRRDAVRSLVYASSGSAVETTIVNGTVVVRDGVPQTWDPTALGAEVAERAARLDAQLDLRLDPVWPVTT